MSEIHIKTGRMNHMIKLIAINTHTTEIIIKYVFVVENYIV